MIGGDAGFVGIIVNRGRTILPGYNGRNALDFILIVIESSYYRANRSAMGIKLNNFIHPGVLPWLSSD